MDNGGVSRRGTLKYLGLLAASVAGREFLAAWLPLSSVHAAGHHGLVTIQGIDHAPDDLERPAAYVPQFFKPDDFKTIELLVEMILPTDDKPGAKEANVADYVDFVVFSAREFEPSLQGEWTDGLVFLDRESQKQFGKVFRMASMAQREKFLSEMSLPERDLTARHEGYWFFRLVKNITVEGFYTSRIGLIEVLDYQGMSYLSEFSGCTHPEHQH